MREERRGNVPLLPLVRFSVWDDGVAQTAVSLDEEESRRLAAFIEAT